MMKIKTFTLFLLLALLISSCKDPLEEAYLESMEIYRAEVNREFADSATSPLTSEDLIHFHGLEFFPVTKEYMVRARFVRNPAPEPFGMETNTPRRPVYVKYGEAHFTLKGEDHMLEISQSEAASQMEEFRDHLFLPFKDLTNGVSSYGGGRFIDLKIPEGNTIIIDFNKAYNPYCAYNHRYSCPIPPRVNHLNIPIPAGVKAYKEH